MNSVNGIIVPTITLFDNNGHIQEKENIVLLTHILQQNPDYVFVMGSTGEGLFFKDKIDEKLKYLKLISQYLSSFQQGKFRSSLLIGIYGESSEEVIADAKRIEGVIDNPIFVVPPPVKRRLKEEEQIEFYSSILKHIPYPIILYNNPSTFGGTNISKAALQELKEYSNCNGIKDSSASLETKKEYLELLEKDFIVSCGKEGMLADFLELVEKKERDKVGLVPSISNLVKTCQDIYNLGLKGKDTEMKALQSYLNSFRGKIYDSEIPRGKAQRGLKLAFSYLYGPHSLLKESTTQEKIKIPIPENLPVVNISTEVSPSLKRDIPENIKNEIKKTLIQVLNEGHINLFSENIIDTKEL